jgi:hypothetical protein
MTSTTVLLLAAEGTVEFKKPIMSKQVNALAMHTVCKGNGQLQPS